MTTKTKDTTKKTDDTKAAPAVKKIKILVDANPKRPSGASHARFALYKNGMTTEEYITAVDDRGRATADLKWDVERKFIELVD